MVPVIETLYGIYRVYSMGDNLLFFPERNHYPGLFLWVPVKFCFFGTRLFSVLGTCLVSVLVPPWLLFWVPVLVPRLVPCCESLP